MMHRIFIRLFCSIMIIILCSNLFAILNITVTINPYYLILKDIVNGKAEITMLLKPGRNPHIYSPTVEDIKKMMKSDLVVVNGLNLETFILPKLSKLKDEGIDILYVSKFIPMNELIGKEGRFNPHIWLDPVYLYKYIIPGLLNELKKLDPSNSVFYERNATRLVAELKEFDKDCENCMKKLKCKSILTTHPSFDYFARRYEINVTSLYTGHGRQPTLREMMEVIRMIKEGKICAIFSEKGINSKAMDVIVGETNVRKGELDPLGFDAKNTIDLLEENLRELMKTNGLTK